MLIATEFREYEVDLNKNELRAAGKWVAYMAGAANVERGTAAVEAYIEYQIMLLKPRAAENDGFNPHDVYAIWQRARHETERVRRMLGIPAAQPMEGC